MAVCEMFQRSVTVFGVPLDVAFSYSKGYPATQDEPEAPDEIYIDAVMFNDFDILNLIGTKGLEEIEKELFKLLDMSKDKEDINEC